MVMDMDTVYEEAARGNLAAFQELNEDQLLQLVTPINKDTILHIHITATSSHATLEVKQLPSLFEISEFPVSSYKVLLEMIISKVKRRLREEPVNFVERVLQTSSDMLWMTNANNETLLHLAARYGRNDIVQILIPKRQKAKATSEDEEAAKATSEDLEVDQEAARKMLEIVNKAGDTALHEAALYNHPQVVKTLIDMDCNYSYGTNNDDKTPLYLAAEMGHGKVVSEILNSCKSPAYQGPGGKTALHAAVLCNDREITRMIASNDKLKDLTKVVDDELGWTPLHYAAQRGFLRVVVILLEEDKSAAYIGDKDHNMTALHIAAKYRRAHVMWEIMSSCPQSCEQVDNEERNLLHFVIKGNSKRALSAVLSHPYVGLNLMNKGTKEGNCRPLNQLPSTLRKGYKGIYQRYNIVEFGEWEDITGEEDSEEDNIDEGKGPTGKEVRESNKDSGKGDEEGRKELGSKKDSSKDDEDQGKGGTSNKGISSKDEQQTYLVVATLIATVTFAAIFTLPGGYTTDKGPDQGSPILINSAAFKVFVVADIISLVLSIFAVFFHIARVLNRNKMPRTALDVVGIATFYALTAMIIAFCAGTYAMLSRSSNSRWLATFSCVLPPVLFFYLGFTNRVQVERSKIPITPHTCGYLRAG